MLVQPWRLCAANSRQYDNSVSVRAFSRFLFRPQIEDLLGAPKLMYLINSSSWKWIRLLDSKWTFCFFRTSINLICFLISTSSSTFCFSSTWKRTNGNDFRQEACEAVTPLALPDTYNFWNGRLGSSSSGSANPIALRIHNTALVAGDDRWPTNHWNHPFYM